MSFSNYLSQILYIDFSFTDDLNNATFPMTTFQNITFNDPSISLALFTVKFAWTGTGSYRI